MAYSSDSQQFNDKTRKSWSEQDDQVLTKLVKKYGTKRWSDISKAMVQMFQMTDKSGKQCRQRWVNHLDPKINNNQWTIQEERIIFDAHKIYGNKWKQMAKLLKDRTDNSIKNHFYSILRKGLRRINKMIGDRKSTQKIKEIRTSVLSKLFKIQTAEKIQPQSSQNSKFNQSNIYELLFQFSLMKSGNVSQKNLTIQIKNHFNQMVNQLTLLSTEEKKIKQRNIAVNKQRKSKKSYEMKEQSQNEYLQNIKDLQINIPSEELNFCHIDYINQNARQNNFLVNMQSPQKQKSNSQFDKFVNFPQITKKLEFQENKAQSVKQKSLDIQLIDKNFYNDQTSEKDDDIFCPNITINLEEQQSINYSNSESKDVLNFNCFNTSPLYGLKKNFGLILTRTPRINSPSAFNVYGSATTANSLANFSHAIHKQSYDKSHQYQNIVEQLRSSIQGNSGNSNNMLASCNRVHSSRNANVQPYFLGPQNSCSMTPKSGADKSH